LIKNSSTLDRKPKADSTILDDFYRKLSKDFHL